MTFMRLIQSAGRQALLGKNHIGTTRKVQQFFQEFEEKIVPGVCKLSIDRFWWVGLTLFLNRGGAKFAEEDRDAMEACG